MGKRIPIAQILANQFGGGWTYCGGRWDCDDGRWATRTCSCFPDDSGRCSCFGQIYVYGDGAPEALSNSPTPTGRGLFSKGK